MQTLQQALGYELAHPNPLQRSLQRAASTRPGAWTMSKVLEPLDKVTLRITGGRHTAAALATAVPVITLHTVGARTGAPRTTPLLGIPLEGTLAVIGTNYGQRATPGWVYNLEANPNAEVAYRTARIPVAARAAADGEAEHVYRRAAGIYPGYDAYRSRISNRIIRVFVLDHAG